MVERKMQTLNFAINNYDQNFFWQGWIVCPIFSKHQSEQSLLEISNLAPKPPPMRMQESSEPMRMQESSEPMRMQESSEPMRKQDKLS